MDFDRQAERAIHTGVSEWSKLANEGLAVASFAGFNNEGRFLILLDHEQTPVTALSTVRLIEEDVGARVVAAFERGEAHCPIILGRLQQPTQRHAERNLKIDGERLLIHAEREIELRCGEASIVLTRAGKVLIRGAYVLSRSKGANKIKGAYVDIN
ncbi:MAG: DUF6484 domain-containing protein [Bdellovibrio bacteriovorus]